METSQIAFGFPSVVPYVGTWIEMNYVRLYDDEVEGRSLRGNVDRNLTCQMPIQLFQRRSLRGNVDRNLPRAHGKYHCQ